MKSFDRQTINEPDQKTADSMRRSPLGQEVAAGVEHWLDNESEDRRDESIGLMLAGAACLAELLILFLRDSVDSFDTKDRLYDAWLGGFLAHREAVSDELARLMGQDVVSYLSKVGANHEDTLRTEPAGDSRGTDIRGEGTLPAQVGD